MPAPLAIPAALTVASAIPNIMKIIGGNKELEEARQLAKIKQPTYNIPDAATTALTLTRFNALKTQLPNQGLIENKIGSATAGGIRMATETANSPVEALSAGAAMVGNQQNALADLGIAGANMYEQNQNTLRGEYNNYAGWQEKKQNWDVLQPYIVAKQKEAALNKAGAENVQHGIEGIGGSVTAGISLYNQNSENEKNRDAYKNGSMGYAPPLPTPPQVYPSPAAQPYVAPNLTQPPNPYTSATQTPRQQADIYSMVQRLKMLPQYAGMSDDELGNIVMSQLR